MNKIIPICLVLVGVSVVVLAVKTLVKGTPVDVVTIVLGMSFVPLLIVFMAARRKKSGGASGPPSV